MNRTLRWPRLLRAGLIPLALLAAGSGFTAPTAGGAGSREGVTVKTAEAFTLGGSISGLTLGSMTLVNGSDGVKVLAGASSFTFPTALAAGTPYDVRITLQPQGLDCPITNGSGSMPAANVSNVVISCSPKAFTLGGSISGLASGGLVLANGNDTLSVAANATSFTMPKAVPFGSPYNVTVKTQALDHTCAVANGSGTMPAVNVKNVSLGCVAASYTVGTFAGSGTPDSVDGTGTAASFNNPSGVVFDASGNLYVVEISGNKIRKVTPAGVVSTLAGSGEVGDTDGRGAAASFNLPSAIAIDARGNLYVADWGNNKIRKITPAGRVSTFAGSGAPGSTDGKGRAASFNGPAGVAVDTRGNVYVTDLGNFKIRKITSAGKVSTMAGSGIQADVDGVGTQASFTAPFGIAVDGGGILYVTDDVTRKIRKITADGTVSTLPSPASARYGVAVSSDGHLYVTDTHQISRVAPSGVTKVLAGSTIAGDVDGPGALARFDIVVGIAIDGAGDLFVGDLNNHKVRKIERD